MTYTSPTQNLKNSVHFLISPSEFIETTVMDSACYSVKTDDLELYRAT
jgi:hypothetical protein